MDVFRRLFAMIVKEGRQLSRDRLTMAMVFGIPIMQLILFGYAINMDPKGLPTAVLQYDHSSLSRAIVAAIDNTGYFHAGRPVTSEAEARDLMQSGDLQFVVTVPPDLLKHVIRREPASIAVEADATDPATIGPAVSAISLAVNQALQQRFAGPLAAYRPSPQAVGIILHNRYNPETVTRFNIVPGLIGVILTMTLVMMTALAVTREFERGTMENLLAMPVRPIEVMAGKITPYILIGLVQVAVILIASKLLFNVPFEGDAMLFAVATILFITVNLSIGFTFSTIARNQLQAVQMSVFFLMPTILLSGFAFPFRGMPLWAQRVGEALPATHFNRIVRGVMLKGVTFDQVAIELAALAVMLVIVVTVAVSRYRVTLD